MNETNTTEATHPVLFPLSALQTEGFAQPEPRDDDTAVEDDDAGAEAA